MSRRMEILRRATEVFQRQGFAGTSIEDIGKAVGIKREGIYYYFKSKEDMLLEIILPQSNSLLLGMRTVLRANVGSAEKLHLAIEGHLSSFNPTYLEMIVALREGHNFKNHNKLKELRRIWRDYSGLWIDLVREGQQRGEFDPTLDPKLVAYGVLGMVNWLSRWFDPEKEIKIPQIIDTFFTLASRGLVRGPFDFAVTSEADQETAPAAGE